MSPSKRLPQVRRLSWPGGKLGRAGGSTRKRAQAAGQVRALDSRASAFYKQAMAHETRRFWLTFSGEASRRPLISQMSRKFNLEFNIRNSSVTPSVGIIALELAGEREVIKEAIAWFESEGVQVEPVEINTIEG